MLAVRQMNVLMDILSQPQITVDPLAMKNREDRGVVTSHRG